MANKITNTQYYQDIANAIRAKNGGSTLYTPPQMAQAILDIPTGSDKPFRYTFQQTVYGVGSSYVSQYGIEQTHIITSQIKALLDVTKVRIRGYFQSQSNNANKKCTSTLVARKWTGNTYTDQTISSISSNSSVGIYTNRVSFDETFYLDRDNIDELYLRVTSQSNYNNATYPIDKDTVTSFSALGTTIDGVPWYGCVVDYLFD